MYNRKNYISLLSLLACIVLMISSCDPSKPKPKQPKSSSPNREVKDNNEVPLPQFSAAAASAYHTLAITKTGALYAWGLNSYGQLGIGNTINKNTPTRVLMQKPTTWKTVSARANHTLAITTDGALYAWGNNKNGQLGLEHRVKQNIPQQVGQKTN